MKQINDRFTFDSLFRKLLTEYESEEDVLNYILTCYSLSTMVFQERVENKYYRKIKVDEEISADLLELKKECFWELFENFYKRRNKLLNSQKFISEQYRRNQKIKKIE